MDTPCADVPFIDIAPLFGSDADAKRKVASQIDAACRGSGFFYVSNHGAPIQELVDTTNTFHRTMTEEEKYQLAIRAYNPTSTRIRSGYYMAKKGSKAVESFCSLNPVFTSEHPLIIASTPLHEVNVWPEEERHPGFRAFNEKYFSTMCGLSSVLLRGFALALGKDEHFFDEYFKHSDTLSSSVLIRYPYLEDYPPVKLAPDGTQLSFEDHQDVSLITVLFQTPVPNLQVETPSGYQDVPTSGQCYLINCGTYMAHITNNYYPAPVHRVKYINEERLSLPFFVNLGHTSTIEPFTPHKNSESANKAVSYGQYLTEGLHKLIVKNGQT